MGPNDHDELAEMQARMDRDERYYTDRNDSQRAEIMRLHSVCMSKDEDIAKLREALRSLHQVVLDARLDGDCDVSSAAGGYIFGDVMSKAMEKAEAALEETE